MTIWDLEASCCIACVQAHTACVTDILIDSTSGRLLSGARCGSLLLWSLSDLCRYGAGAQQMRGRCGDTNCIVANWASMLAISGSEQGTLLLWDLAAATCVQSWHADSSSIFQGITSLAVDWTRLQAFSACHTGDVKIWELSQTGGGQILYNHGNKACSSISARCDAPDGKARHLLCRHFSEGGSEDVGTDAEAETLPVQRCDNTDALASASATPGPNLPMVNKSGSDTTQLTDCKESNHVVVSRSLAHRTELATPPASNGWRLLRLCRTALPCGFLLWLMYRGAREWYRHGSWLRLLTALRDRTSHGLSIVSK